MDGNTEIATTGTSISTPRDANIGALTFYDNSKIRFLPENPARNFPNLVLYDASDCAVQAVTRANFRSLHKLQRLFLNGNEIPKIERNTFDDLTSLEELDLSEIVRLIDVTKYLLFQFQMKIL